jgi:hypothetical protein
MVDPSDSPMARVEASPMGERDERRPSSRPPRLMQVVSNSKAGAEQESESDAEVKKPDSSTRSQEDSARSAASKRSRPPYLRLVD